MKTKSEPLGAAAAFGLLAIGGGVGAAALDMSPAWAALDTRSYEISSGPVTTALQRFAEKSGAVLIYNSALARGKTTAGFKGNATVTEALGVLLSGTGLSYSLAPGKKSVAIMLAQNEGVRSDAGAEALPAIDIGAERPATRGPRQRQAGSHAAELLCHAGRVHRHQDRHAGHEHAGQCAGGHAEGDRGSAGDHARRGAAAMSAASSSARPPRRRPWLSNQRNIHSRLFDQKYLSRRISRRRLRRRRWRGPLGRSRNSPMWRA